MSNLERCLLLKKQLDDIRPLSKENELRIMQKFRLDWNFHSNHLEGNQLTYGETKALILFGITAQGKPLKDHFEITGHDDAINWVIDVLKEDRPLTESFIRQLHQLILKEPYTTDAITPEGKPTKKKIQVGQYKSTSNHVKTKTGEIFRFATPEETPALMSDLVNWYEKKILEYEVNPILLAAEFHYRFIRIHPFDDGNGRTVRILMNFILMKFGYPPVIIKTEDKQNYFSALQQADAGIIEPFVEYIAENLAHSLEIMIKGAKGENIEEPDDIEKEIALLDQKITQRRQTMGLEIGDRKKVILSIFNDSILRTIKEYGFKNKLLKKYYTDSSIGLAFDNKTPINISDLILDRTKILELAFRKIDVKQASIDLVLNYYTFKEVGVPKFDYQAIISFVFKTNGFGVKNQSDLELKKDYNEQLSEEEINQLINSEIRRHKQFIEQKIEEVNTTKK